MRLFLNAVLFQIEWWICIASAGHTLEIQALLLGCGLVFLHLMLSRRRAADIQLALVVLILGMATDSLLQYFGVVSFYGWSLGPLSPFWLWLVWIFFSFTLNSSLSFLKKRTWVVCALAGFLFGPISYLAGVKLGAAEFDNSFGHLMALACSWMLVLPVLFILNKKLFPST